MSLSGPLSSGPLSFGQLSCWRDVEFHPRDRWHEPNGAEVWPLPPGTTVDRALAGLEYLAARHASLRTTYDITDKKNPIQRAHSPGGPLDVDVVSGREPAAIAHDLERTAFDLRTDYSWRARIVVTGGAATQVVFANHHIAADAYSRRLMQDELTAVVSAPGPIPRGEAEYSLVEMAVAERSEQFRPKHEAALRHWEKMLTATHAAPAPLGADGGPFRESGSPVLLANLSSVTARAAAWAQADRLGVSPASVLLSAYLVAAGQVYDLRSLPARLISSNRFSARLQNHVTSLNSWTPMQLDLSPGEQFDAVASRVSRLSLQAYRHGIHDLDRVAELREQIASGTPESVWSFNFFATDLPAEPVDDERPEITWDEPFHAIGPRFYLRAVDTGEAVTLKLRARDTTRAHVSAVLLRMHSLLTPREGLLHSV